MKTRNLLVAAVVLFGLSGLVWWAKKHPSSPSSDTNTPPAPKVADIPQSSIASVDITRAGQPAITLQHAGDKWTITAPEPLPADQDAVSTAVATFSPLSADSVADEHAGNLAQFGLSSPALTVAVHRKSGKTDTFQFGGDVPIGSLVYLKTGADPKVYAVSSSAKTALDKSTNDFRDKRLLAFDSGKLTGVEIGNAKGSFDFAKNTSGDWQIVKPQPYRADSLQVEELIRKLSDAKMEGASAADEAKKADAAFAGGIPFASAKVTDSNGTKTLTIRKNMSDFYAKSSALPGAYKVTADLGSEFNKTADDFRNKKLFDFGFSDPTKIIIHQNGGDLTLLRSGSDWKSGGKAMDSGQAQALIDKLRDLTASGFATPPFPATVVTIEVISNDGKRDERVEFAKAASGYVARRQNEPAVYLLPADAVDAILKSSTELKPAKK